MRPKTLVLKSITNEAVKLDQRFYLLFSLLIVLYFYSTHVFPFCRQISFVDLVPTTKGVCKNTAN